MAEKHWEVVQELVQDANAIEFLRDFNLVANVWDDLVDRDVATPEPARVSDAFVAAMVRIPTNPFFRAHRDELQPVMEMALTDWLAANVMQASNDPESITRAHVMRFNGLSVWVMCVRICSGIDAAAAAAVQLRQLIPAETLPEFIKEIRP